jgi:hypothetical protein
VNEVMVSLNLTSKERLPEEVSVLTGLRQTKMWRAGDVIEGATRLYSCNGWSLESGLGSGADLESHILFLIKTIRPAIMALKELSENWDIELDCSVYAKSYVSPLYFNREVVQVLAAIGAQVDIDLYCGGSDPLMLVIDYTRVE